MACRLSHGVKYILLLATRELATATTRMFCFQHGIVHMLPCMK